MDVWAYEVMIMQVQIAFHIRAYLIPRGIFELEGYDDTDAALVVGKDIFALDSGGPRQMYGLKYSR